MSENAIVEQESRAARELREVIESGRPLTYIQSAEEQRIDSLLHEVAARLFQPAALIWTWTLTEGLRCGTEVAVDGTVAPRAALDFIAAQPGPAIFLLKDFHEPMRDSAEVRRRLRDLYDVCFDRQKFVIVSSPVQFIPSELERNLVFMQLGMPDLVEIGQFLDVEMKQLVASGHAVDTSEGTRHQIARAVQGLTLDEARHAVRRAVAGGRKLDSASLPILLEEKRLLVNRTGLVQFVSEPTNIDAIGGLEILKAWLLERRKLFLMRDEINRDIVPKGVLIMGISGCGKSLSVKAIAATFELPLYRIDMTEIFSGRHGKPEAAFAKACYLLEEISPAVVWFDEIEMAITSAENAGEQGRLFAFFLTWMQEKTRGLFVAATANRIDLLPAEMIRKGRFDEVFFVDIPLEDERVDIFRIHMQRRGVDPSTFNLDRLKRFTKGWTGAEVEQCVVSAFTAAQLEGREVTDDDLLNASSTIVPLSKTMKEQVDHIREWAFERAVRASPREFGR